jgi:hypothetical protein
MMDDDLREEMRVNGKEKLKEVAVITRRGEKM